MRRSSGEQHRSALRVVVRVLMVICLLGVLWSACMLYLSQREYDRGDAAYEQVRTLLEMDQKRDLQVDSLQKGEPAHPREPKQVDFSALQEINDEVVAWLEAEDSIIDYPVVQGKDNDYYLNHLFTKEKNKLGSLFVDYRTPGDFSGKNTIIYGHNMKDGSMFASLIDYNQQSYYDEHSVMRLHTPGGVYSIELFAGIVADGDKEFIPTHFKDDADFLAYIDGLRQESSFDSGVELTAQDRIVSLVTCSYEFNNARYALFGKLVEAGESE